MLRQDGRITSTGGSNTSSKLEDVAALTGAAMRVRWVMGSGGDLRTSAARENFSRCTSTKLWCYMRERRSLAPNPVAEDGRGLYSHTPSPSSRAMVPSTGSFMWTVFTGRCFFRLKSFS